MSKQPDSPHLDSVHLTESEHASMRGFLVAHMDAHPLPIRSPYLRVFRYVSPIRKDMLRPFAYAFSALLIISTGTAAAAEGALPGDVLYAIKVNVNEKVQGAFIGHSPEAKAAFALEIADRRLAEASITASATTTVSQKNKQGAGVWVAQAAKEAEEAIAKLEAEDPRAAAHTRAQLDASFSAHEGLLTDLAASGDVEAGEVLEKYITRKAKNADEPKEEDVDERAEADEEDAASDEEPVSNAPPSPVPPGPEAGS